MGEFDDAFLGECALPAESGRGTGPWRVPIGIGQGKVLFKVDSGADVSLLSYRTFQRLGQMVNLPPLENSTMSLNSPTGPIPVKGKIGVKLRYKDIKVSEDLFVMAEERQTDNLLSRRASVGLGLIQFIGNGDVSENLFGFGEWNT